MIWLYQTGFFKILLKKLIDEHVSLNLGIKWLEKIIELYDKQPKKN